MTEPRIDYALGEYQSAFAEALEKLRREDFIGRLRAKDHTLWKSKPDEITNRLGWLNAPAETLTKTDDILSVAQSLKAQGVCDIFLIGIGGSSLAAEVFCKIFGYRSGCPRLHVVDTTDPVLISRIAQTLRWEKSLFVVSSKSGTTLEVTSLFKYFHHLARKRFAHEAGDRFIFITDEGSPLIKTAQSISARYIFLNNPDIGGRFSALSLFGMVPAALAGMDIRTLLTDVAGNTEALMRAGSSLGAALGMLATQGRDKLTLMLSPRWQPFGDWLEQLIAESTGKEGKAILPVLDETLWNASQYGKDRLFVVFKNENDAEPSDTTPLMKAGHPVMTVTMEDDYTLGQHLYLWEMATAVAAHFLGVNPFDQPDVEATKKHTREAIVKSNADGKSALAVPSRGDGDVTVFGSIQGATLSEILTNLLAPAPPGSYVCLQIYLNRSAEIETAIRDLRKAVLRKYGLPVTAGYGPRYLHSTGQLHKGDAGNGIFIQLTQDYPVDEKIPDAIGADTSALTFGRLIAAQAQGDFQALTEKKRRIIRFHFATNPSAGLKTLTAAV